MTNDPNLERVLEELRTKCEHLPEFGLQLAAAIDVFHDVPTVVEFLQIKDSESIDVAGETDFLRD